MKVRELPAALALLALITLLGTVKLWAADSLPPLKDGKSPQSLEELWAGYEVIDFFNPELEEPKTFLAFCSAPGINGLDAPVESGRLKLFSSSGPIIAMILRSIPNSGKRPSRPSMINATS